MNEKNRNLLVRLATALAWIPPVLYLLFRGGLPMAALVSFTISVVLYELYGMSLGKLDAAQVTGIATGAFLPFAFTLWPHRADTIAVGLLVFLVIATATMHLVRGEVEKAPGRVAMLVCGVVYCGLTLTTVCGVRRMPDGVNWLLLLLFCNFLNDTGAYAFGRMFGRHKMAPAISPSKTWEGFAGGMATSLGAAFAIRGLFFSSMTLVDCVAVPLGVSVLGPLGDFSESMFKRAYGVKDSGKIMPGHGGMLDRVDALVFNAPFVYAYLLVRAALPQ